MTPDTKLIVDNVAWQPTGAGATANARHLMRKLTLSNGSESATAAVSVYSGTQRILGPIFLFPFSSPHVEDYGSEESAWLPCGVNEALTIQAVGADASGVGASILFGTKKLAGK